MTVPQIPGTRVRSRRGDSMWEVKAERLQDLQVLVVTSVGSAALSELDVTVSRWRPPMAGWLGCLALPKVSSLSAEPKGNGIRVRVALTEPLDSSLVLAAVVRVLRPVERDIGPELTFTPGLPAAAASLAGRLRDVLLVDETRDRHVRRCDTLVAPDVDSASWPERESTVHVSKDGWTTDGVFFDVCVDPTVHRPIGRRSVGATSAATATVTGGVVTLVADGTKIVLGRTVTEASTRALRQVGVVEAVGLPEHIAHQLHACGVVVVQPGHDLPDPDDHLAWQAWSVHERRHALRQYGPAAALDAWPSVSVVLVTHRPDHLDHAFSQLAALRYPRLEAVIGVHGDHIDGARVWELAQDLPFGATVVPVDGELTLGEALQLCSDRAEGALITKMDDDDVYGPEHVWDLVLARQYSGAQIVGKTLDWIYLESEDSTVFRPTYAAEKYADFVAGGTMLISRADLAAVGGWRPVPKSVDRALLDRVLADGGLVYRTHGLGYVYVRHSAGHTASVRDEHFLTKTAATFPGLVSHAAFGTAGAGA